MNRIPHYVLLLLTAVMIVMTGWSCASAEEPKEGESLFEYRLRKEKECLPNEYAITPYKPNYMLYTYNGYPNPGTNELYNGPAQERELKFQVSLKYCVLCREDFQWHVAYTQQAYWQAFKLSAPFRETTHEPETMLTWLTDSGEFGGFKLPRVTVGLDHQSNGRSEPDSRSWNRAYADVLLQFHNFYISIKPWYRFVESAASDDNPDIIRYMGYGELRFLYGHRDHDLSLMIRNNLRKETKGAYEASWSHPFSKERKNFRYYVQFFSGYGENLIDYNHANRRIGVGIMLNDWL